MSCRTAMVSNGLHTNLFFHGLKCLLRIVLSPKLSILLQIVEFTELLVSQVNLFTPLNIVNNTTKGLFPHLSEHGGNVCLHLQLAHSRSIPKTLLHGFAINSHINKVQRRFLLHSVA